MSFWHRTGHILAQIGLGTVQVANVAGKFVPFPFNIAVSGGAAIATVVIAKTHKPSGPEAPPVLTPASET